MIVAYFNNMADYELAVDRDLELLPLPGAKGKMATILDSRQEMENS